MSHRPNLAEHQLHVLEVNALSAAPGAPELNPARVIVPGVWIGAAAWSPDGTRLAAHFYSPSSLEVGIGLLRPDGSDFSLIAATISPGAAFAGPSWSPDGSEILYTAGGEAAATRGLWVVNVQSGAARQLTVGGAYGRWSPDGSRIAYLEGTLHDVGFPGSGGAMILIDRDGANRRTVATFTDLPPTRVSWSPDGTSLLYAHGLPADLFIVSAGGGTPQRLATTADLVELEPHWAGTP